MKAIGFDLGRTLVGYENIPLSWESLYEDALRNVLVKCELKADSNKIAMGKEILSKYNTRINYRENEVNSDLIFFEILDKWGINRNKYLGISKAAFFKYFQQNVMLYEDTILTLQKLKEKDFKIGILTDVPYGMGKEYVLKDIEQFKEYVDVILTSVEVGYRKPNAKGYKELSSKLCVSESDMIFIGDESKDIIGANNAGMFSVLINRTNEVFNYGQKKTIKSLVELLEI
jgi:putative hydrolase of the HAD superfamily